MKNSNIIWKKIAIKCISSLVFLACSIAPFLLMKQTLNSKLNRWSNDFNNYYVNNYVVNETAPIIRIQSKEKNVLSDLYNTFYYTNSSTVNSSFRQFYSGESYFVSCFNKEYSICLNKQTGFNIGDKYDWGYYLDNGLFSTYFKDEVLPNKGYWNRRYGANGVCFISDTLADKLVVEYGIVDEITETNRIYAYKKLIKPSESDSLSEPTALPTLGLKIGEETKDIKFCINNILYSEYRTGPRVQQLYGDFCVMFGDPFTDNQLRYCAEFDMKNDIYGNTTFLKRVNALGYNKDNANYSFYKYNHSQNKYNEINELRSSFEAIDFSQNDTGFYIASFIISFGFICFVFLWKKEMLFSLIATLLIFGIYNLVLCFVFVEPLCNLFVTLNILAILIIYGSRLFLSSFRISKRKGGEIFNYEEITI